MTGDRRAANGRQVAWLLLAVAGAGVLLRSLRLAWQPLWWDEGYSVYFGTEPLGRMLWLTARDIHPPLYYALLHGWTLLFRGADPVTIRALSVLFGAAALPIIFWLGRLLFPQYARVAWVALLLLAVSPIHLFYSQEVRMYGLAMALGLAATTSFWLFVLRVEQAGPARALRTWPAVAYLLTIVALLYTLYYGALLILAHLVWAAWHWRRKLAAAGALIAVYLLAALVYLPWLLYAIPQLIGYVGGKVQSDQDIPLGPLAYAERHLVAFTAGQVRPPWLAGELWMLAAPTAGICLLILGLVLRATLRTTPTAPPETAPPAARPSPAATGALWVWLLAPLAIGWLINLRLPFFPEGGERLLLITLPYFLILLAVAVDRTWTTWHLGKLGLAALLAGSLVGVAAFYTTPRYAADDYRPLLRQVVQQGRDEDTFLAIFPWQVGYWRAYVPQGDPLLAGPRPLLLADGAVEWGPAVQATLDRALEAGTLWFPEPLTFGSTLPPAIEEYLAGEAVSLENRWYDATRLTAWRRMPPPVLEPATADFGPLRLLAAGIEPKAATSANEPVAVRLVWDNRNAEEFNVSLRIQRKDDSGADQLWASRETVTGALNAVGVYTETVGLIVPVGLPPGAYTVAVSVQHPDGTTLTVGGSDALAAAVGTLEVMQPVSTQSPLRLPMQNVLARPIADQGLAIVGYSGADSDPPLLAGTPLAVTLFLANAGGAPPERHLYLSLQDQQGAGVAGFEGWPLPDYPTTTWLPGALVQVPVSFFLPGTLATGNYRLAAGFLDPATGEKSTPVALTEVAVAQRSARFDAPPMQVTLPAPATFGTHLRLHGYDLEEEGDLVRLVLHWEVTQPLLPPHHIFVHADDSSGATVAQQDGPPQTKAGLAPSGSWQPGEHLTTEHRLMIPPAAAPTLRVGLYDPTTQMRLPVTVAGVPAGDSIPIAMP